jgi:hypothetical protein
VALQLRSLGTEALSYSRVCCAFGKISATFVKNFSEYPMSNAKNAKSIPGQACQILPADAIYVCIGVNHGDGLDGPEDVVPGDLYMLDPKHAALRLVVERRDQGQNVGIGSAIGQPGDALRIEARYTLMAADGDAVDLILLSLPDGSRYVLPLSPMATQTEYTLVQVDVEPEISGLSDLLCISFARGTHISLASGEQRAIEDLVAGDRLLTRDHGGRPLRWVGKTTLRAVGAFAPVVITAGTLGNSGDLIVSQHHRMFLYQREKKAGLPTSELLVQAKHLVDNDAVFIREGSFVDYFSLVFDHHEIIYAEGIPAESLMVNDATVSRLPAELSAEVKARFPGLTQNQHFGTEAGRQFLDQIGPASLYKSRDRQR